MKNICEICGEIRELLNKQQDCQEECESCVLSTKKTIHTFLNKQNKADEPRDCIAEIDEELDAMGEMIMNLRMQISLWKQAKRYGLIPDN